jgi:hypothetical protein
MSNCEKPITLVKGLFSSCAIPEDSSPIDAKRSARMSCSSIRFYWVISLATTIEPVTSPFSLNSGELDS